MDFDADRLLGDLEGDERDARRRLLVHLVEQGFTEAQLSQAVAEDRLVLLEVERLLGGRYTANEDRAARATGQDDRRRGDVRQP